MANVIPGKQQAFDAVNDASAAVKASLERLTVPGELDGQEDDAVKQARSALNQAASVLDAEAHQLEMQVATLKQAKE